MKQTSLHKRILLPLFFMAICLHLQAEGVTGTINVGNVFFEATASGKTGTGWSWDETSATLTLTSDYNSSYIKFALGDNDNVTLKYSGDITIGPMGILPLSFTGGSLTIQEISTGTLTFNSNSIFNPIWIEKGDLIIESGTVKVGNTGTNYGIYMQEGDLTVTGTAKLDVKSIGDQAKCLFMDNSKITINTSADCSFTTIGNHNGIDSQGDLAIDLKGMSGTLTISGGNGIYMSDNGKLDITGKMAENGKLEVIGNINSAISLANDMTINVEGKINITTQTTGGAPAIRDPSFSRENFIIENGDVTIAASASGTGTATNCHPTVSGGTVLFKGEITKDLIINGGEVTTQTVEGIDAHASDMVTGLIIFLDGTLNNANASPITKANDFITALESTDASLAIALSDDITLTTPDVKAGANHAIFTNGQTLTIKEGGFINFNDKAITINGGGTVNIENTDQDGFLGSSGTATNHFRDVTINLRNSISGGINIDGYVKIYDGAVINLDSPTAEKLLTIPTGAYMSINGSGEINVSAFSGTGIYNKGVLDIGSGKLTIDPGEGNNYGIENCEGALIKIAWGTLTATTGSAIYLAESSKISFMSGNFSDGGITLTNNGDITVASANTPASANSLTEGLYTWNDTKTLFAKGNTNTPAPSTYHTISLIVGEGIDCNYMTSDHTIAEGDHLFLTFYTENPELTAEEILFLIDGVETAFKTSIDGKGGSYILNPIEKDQLIEIRLREGAIDPDPNPDPTGNLDLAEGKIQITMNNGQWTIDNKMTTAVDVSVYDITGKSVMSLRGLRGSRIITLPAGIYIVRAGQQTWKIILNN